MNFAKRFDGPIFFTEQIRGFRVAAFRVAAHGGTVEDLDSGSARLDLAGNSGLSHHIQPILSRLPIGAASKLFHFRYITVNEWLQSTPAAEAYDLISGLQPGAKEQHCRVWRAAAAQSSKPP